MTVALLAKGIDAFSGWDPWPIVAMKDVPGADRGHARRRRDLLSRLQRGACAPWVEKNGETIEKFLAAVSEADKWMRANPKHAAQVATRWIPGLKPDVAEAAMQFNIQQTDRRLSANNYRALWAAQDRLSRLGISSRPSTSTSTSSPSTSLKVMKDKPELFSDLPPIPAEVAVKPGYAFKP